MELKEIPLLKSPSIDEKSAIKYVNIDTPLFIMIYLASNTNNDILIEKDNEYALQLPIYCQSLMKSTIPRNLNAISSMIINKTLIENNENYNRLLKNRQYSILNKLDNSIDLNRFENDCEYRRLTILGLFMCDDPSFEYVKCLHTNVFPFIDGKDYERLKLFYDIKKSLGDLTHAQKHIQAIQQLTNTLNYDFDYKLFLSSPELFIEKYSNDSNIINVGLAVDEVKVSSSLIVSSSWIYSYYLRYNPSSSLIFDLLNRIILFEDFNLCINNLLSSRNILSINKRIKIIEYSIKQIMSKQDEQWKILEEKLNKCLLRLEVLYKLLPDYTQDEINQLDQCEYVQQQEQILSDLLCKHGQFHLIIYLKTSIFPDISIYQILRLTIEQISEDIK
ncbi:unnamed protein product [Rotaria sp. Silwood2]|nr:unnamed protein product [Rotaria sp. Silwood2]